MSECSARAGAKIRRVGNDWHRHRCVGLPLASSHAASASSAAACRCNSCASSFRLMVAASTRQRSASAWSAAGSNLGIKCPKKSVRGNIFNSCAACNVFIRLPGLRGCGQRSGLHAADAQIRTMAHPKFRAGEGHRSGPALARLTTPGLRAAPLRIYAGPARICPSADLSGDVIADEFA